MTRDIEFRTRLNELIEDDADDQAIIKLCLEQAWNHWPHAFEQWLRDKRRYGGFD